MALSLQLAVAEVGRGVRGSGVSVEVIGVCVGTVKPCFVGGRVEVTKGGGALVPESACETETQAVKAHARSNVNIFFLFIG